MKTDISISLGGAVRPGQAVASRTTLIRFGSGVARTVSG